MAIIRRIANLFSRSKIDASIAELNEERTTVKGQGLI